MTFVRVVAGLSLATGLAVAEPAAAACHAFTISASPSSLAEGASTTVTVSRDADLNPSSVRVRTVDGTAKAGSDYAAADRTVAFTDDTAQSFTVATTNDAAAEGAETFRVELVEGSGGGCPVNSDFQYGPPATVTIRASDQPVATTPPTNPPTKPPTTPPATARPTTPAPTLSRTSAPATTPPAVGTTAPATSTPTTVALGTTSPPVETTSAEPSVLSTPVAADDGDGGLPIVPLALVLIAAGGGLGFVAYRRLRA